MANVSRVNGFRPVKHLDGSPFNGQVNRYFVAASDATAVYNGDLVKLAATSDTAGQTVIPGVPSIGGTQGVSKFVAGTDSAAVGVAVGFMINPLNLNSPQFRPASTAMYVLVADSPDVLFEVQVDSTTGGGNTAGVIAAANFNKNYSVSDAGGSAVTGYSGQQVQASSAATTATLTLKMQGAIQKVDNDITSASVKVLVSINNHQYEGTGVLAV